MSAFFAALEVLRESSSGGRFLWSVPTMDGPHHVDFFFLKQRAAPPGPVTGSQEEEPVHGMCSFPAVESERASPRNVQLLLMSTLNDALN